MRIGIVTQPLHWNYGGILQNYALQTVLKRMGHEPITILYQDIIPVHKYILITVKSCLLYIFPSKRREFSSRNALSIALKGRSTEKFVHDHICTTASVKSYGRHLIKKYKLDAIITGSDQVWRPAYNKYLYDMYLKFSMNSEIKKIAYSASFGVDTWEYTDIETRECSRLAKRFDAISVREQSGVSLCKEYLGISSTHVLDPTLLLNGDDYSELCNSIPINSDKYIAAYILDNSKKSDETLEIISGELEMPFKKFTSGSNNSLTVEQWIAIFRDAAFVVTDSYHGAVFSIIFQKQFIVFLNQGRGAARIESLLEGLSLQDRIFGSNKGIDSIFRHKIDYNQVVTALSEKQSFSTQFLSNAINSKKD